MPTLEMGLAAPLAANYSGRKEEVWRGCARQGWKILETQLSQLDLVCQEGR
jgi:hypothetical protein